MRNGGAPLVLPRFLLDIVYLDLPKHVMRNVSRFPLRAHTLAVESSIWRGGNGHCDKCPCSAVQNEVHAFFHCQDLLVCSLRKNYSFLVLPFCQSFSVEAPIFCMPYLVKLSLISYLNATKNSAISSQTLWTTFWQAKTSNKPISPTTRLGSTLPCNYLKKNTEGQRQYTLMVYHARIRSGAPTIKLV